MKQSIFSFYDIVRIAHIGTVSILFLIAYLWHTDNIILIASTIAIAILPILVEAWKELREKTIGSSHFFLIATIISILAHELHAITIVLLIVLVGNFLTHLIEEKTERAIESLMQIIPRSALLLTNHGAYKKVAIDEIKPDDIVVIQTGKSIPVDGTIVQGAATINEAALTGESMGKYKQLHELVFAGTFVESGSIMVRTISSGIDTKLGKIAVLVKEAKSAKVPIVSLANSVAWYVTLGIIAIVLLVWRITGDLTTVTTILIFGSPVELTLITPLTILAGVAAAFKNGVIVKGGSALETFAYTDTILFDKTGTLTIGEPAITDIVIFDSTVSAHELVLYAAIAEKRSSHVVSHAIVKKAEELNITIPEPTTYESLTGHGTEITYNNDRYIVGNSHFIESPEHGNIPIPDSMRHVQASTIYVARNNSILGAFLIEDRIRPEAHRTIEQLKDNGISTIILVSGDKKTVAQKVGTALGISQVFGEVQPEDKLKLVKELQEKGFLVAMVGDGINDAPALHQANVGISMGAMGIEPAIEAANIVLMANDLQLLAYTRRLARQTIRIIKQNIVWGLFFTHGLGIILGIWGILKPIEAALFHAIPEMIIFINTARLIWFK